MTDDEELLPGPAAGLADAAAHGLDLAGATGATLGYDDWELDESVRRLQAKVRTWRVDEAQPELAGPEFARRKPAPVTADAPQRRIDRAHAQLPAPHAPARRPGRKLAFVAWCLSFIGLTAFTCGIALLAWSSIERRDELWNFGLTTAIGGQIGLLLGLSVQLDRIWQNGDEAVDQLGRVDAKLHRMERAGSLAIAPPATAAQAFRSLTAGLDRAG